MVMAASEPTPAESLSHSNPHSFPDENPKASAGIVSAVTQGEILFTADIETRLAGFLVFSPTIWKPATALRRDASGVIRRGLPDRIEPLFRRYFFTRSRPHRLQLDHNPPSARRAAHYLIDPRISHRRARQRHRGH